MTSIFLDFLCIRCGQVNQDRHGSAFDIEERCPHCKEHPTFTPEEEKAVHRVNDIPPETFTAIAAWAMENHETIGVTESRLKDGSVGLTLIEISCCFSHPRDIDFKLKGRIRINGYTALTLIKAYDKAFELGFKIQDISYYKNYFSKTN